MTEVLHRSSSKKAHVAVLSFPFGSHTSSLLKFTSRLAVAAPSVTFSFYSTGKANSSAFGSNTPQNIKPYDVADGLPVGYQHSANTVETAIELFLKATPKNFEEALEVATSDIGMKITCVLSHAFIWFAADFAEKLGVPWVPIWSAGLCSLSAHYHTDLIRHTIAAVSHGIVGREDEALGFIPGMSALRIGDLPEGILAGDMNSSFSCMLHRTGQMLPRGAAVGINSFPDLEPVILEDLRSKLQNCLTVGPFTLLTPPPSGSDETGCLPWLDHHQSHSVAYISCGTVAVPKPAELAAIAEALEEKGIPFLWSLEKKQQLKLPSGFIERMGEKSAKMVTWAPQSRVLQHPAVGVYVTHAGWNSVSESITYGVPMMCRPSFGDQKLNARNVSEVWGIGIRLEEFTREALVNAFDLILSKDEGTKIRNKVSALGEKAKNAMGPKGSSTQNLNKLIEIIQKTN
ncbi:PREDICTED: kaempferol 3-O-beta-D-galactosyltransferase-like isoform X2 [Nelumbo nucifera]|uniref:Glycosyltransferase n=1 Tax=Nelumbo nucifera TaxID=4432 RepID=A0A1U8AZ73_NELNU|nr:PREDICTED: kaempferol 3-O-beta-D-galactosyltransferase-like isoform X2 [Nelumbo nucifera]